MAEQKDNYIPDGDTPRRPPPAIPNRPADEGDEDVLASIAHQHASRLGLRQAVSLVEPPVPSEVEGPVRKPIDLREPRSGDVFYVRQAVRKSPHKSARSESADRFMHLAIVAALTGLAVVLYFLSTYFL